MALPERTTHELPAPPSIISALGVGAVTLGLAIGSGELVLWPYLTTVWGPGILWGALVGIGIQACINREVARYALATGESFFTGVARFIPLLAPLWIVSALVLYVWPGWIGSMGNTAQAFFGFGESVMWSWVSLVCIACLVFFGRVAYTVMERVVEGIVVVFFVLLLYVSWHTLTPDIMSAALWGLVSIGWMPDSLDSAAFVGAVAFAGAGGLLNVAVSLWYRDKQHGMGRYAPRIANPFTGKPEAHGAVGYQFALTDTHLSRFRSWMRIATIDQVLIFGMLGLLGLVLVSLNAYAVLSPMGVQVTGDTIIALEAQLFGSLWGTTGTKFFLAIVYLELFSTLWVIIDVCARVVGDVVYIESRHGPFARHLSFIRSWSPHALYYALFFLVLVCNAILIPFAQPFFFLVLSAVCGAAIMALYIPLLFVLNNWYLPAPLRPSWVSSTILLLGAFLYAYLTLALAFGYFM